MRNYAIESVQQRLAAAGFDPGEIDGLWGDKTSDALDRALSAAMGAAPKPNPGGDIPEAYWPMLSKIESNDRLYALPPINPRTGKPFSSASGLFQFIRSTWIGEGGQWGTDEFKAFGGLRPSAEEQLQRVKSFTAKNARDLTRAGLPINEATLYAAHFLGVAGAVRILKADVSTPVAAVTTAGQRRANPSILGGGKTVGDFFSWLHRKTGVWAR